jgi:hypothetical protein
MPRASMRKLRPRPLEHVRAILLPIPHPLPLEVMEHCILHCHAARMVPVLVGGPESCDQEAEKVDLVERDGCTCFLHGILFPQPLVPR